MEKFCGLPTEEKRKAINLWKELINKDFKEYNRVVSKEEYEEAREIRKKMLIKMIKAFKEDIIDDLYNGKYGVYH